MDTSCWILAAGGLGRGEVEAMALYKDLSADALLVDDHRARVIAEHNQINCIGALGPLLFAKQSGAIKEVVPYVEKLRTFSVHYGDTLLDRVLQLAGNREPLEVEGPRLSEGNHCLANKIPTVEQFLTLLKATPSRFTELTSNLTESQAVWLTYRLLDK